MPNLKHHIFVCCSFRGNGNAQGICNKAGAISLLPYLEEELSDRGLHDVQVSSTGCLKVCGEGSAMVVYPEKWWYTGIRGQDDIDTILDALEEGKQAAEYAM
jgi:(2Fe-2S) ferredoxin